MHSSNPNENLTSNAEAVAATSSRTLPTPLQESALKGNQNSYVDKTQSVVINDSEKNDALKNGSSRALPESSSDVVSSTMDEEEEILPNTETSGSNTGPSRGMKQLRKKVLPITISYCNR